MLFLFARISFVCFHVFAFSVWRLHYIKQRAVPYAEVDILVLQEQNIDICYLKRRFSFGVYMFMCSYIR
jgi:hypothetical protein